MSSLSAGLNSLSTATFVDFVTRFGRASGSEQKGIRNAKLITCLWGVAIMTCASLMGGRDTIFEIIAKVMSPFAGPLLGIFLLGMLSRRANSFGAIVGAITAVVATAYATYFTPLHWTWYFAIGTFSVLILGYAFSLFRPTPAADAAT